MARSPFEAPQTLGDTLGGAIPPPGPGQVITETEIINAISAYKNEAELARRDRMDSSRVNREAYMSRQDWSHKEAGQSTEFLPKTAAALEEFASFIKKALTTSGSWFSVSLGRSSDSFLNESQISSLLSAFVQKPFVADNRRLAFPTLLGDAIKVGALESLIVFKVYGVMDTRRVMSVEQGEPLVAADGTESPGEPTLAMKDRSTWQLRIDLIPPDSYYPDPSGEGLYEIQSTERDFSYVLERAEAGIYDADAVMRLADSLVDTEMKEREDTRRPQEVGQNETVKPAFRRKVVIDEFWGNILGEDGDIAFRNVFCVIANGQFMLRPPTPNPFWHQQSPFVAFPLIRVPFSVWHRALYDDATQLNFALNELFNLILDGSISSVWGIKQLRIGDLADPNQVSDGVKQGMTLIVQDSLPHSAKVLETVSEGEVPRDSMVVFEMLSREFTAAALSSELKLGQLPDRRVLATEVVQIQEAQSRTLDGVVTDIEANLAELLKKAWLTIIQNIDDVGTESVLAAIGVAGVFSLAKVPPPARYAMFSHDFQFTVTGLSTAAQRARDFQKLMALMQSVIANPILLQAFFTRFSGDKILAHALKSLGIDVGTIQRDAEELQRLDKEMVMLQQFMAMTSQSGGGGPAQAAGEQPGGPDGSANALPAQINQAANPMTGLTGSE